jgi:nucleotide-binding universal stress UspA family protein
MYRTILVPLDGSAKAEQALPVAVGLARRSNAELRLMHCLDFMSLPPVETNTEWWHACARSDADTYLHDVASRIESSVRVSLITCSDELDAASAILNVANRGGTDLIVMTTHGRGVIDRAWLGSVADAVVRQSCVPVLLLRASPHDALRGEEPFRHVLLPLDGSTLAERMVKPAVRLARANSARLTVLEIVHPWVMAVRPIAHAHHTANLRDVAVEKRSGEAEDYVSCLAMSVDPQLKDVAADVVVAELSDAAEILKYAAAHAVDVIALATHGRSGWRRLILGSVADKLIRGADIPVLVLRPSE